MESKIGLDGYSERTPREAEMTRATYSVVRVQPNGHESTYAIEMPKTTARRFMIDGVRMWRISGTRRTAVLERDDNGIPAYQLKERGQDAGMWVAREEQARQG